MDFTNSIKTVKEYTRSIRTVTKSFGQNEPIPGSGTMFFVNDDGVAITCKHISNVLKHVQSVNQKWDDFLKDKGTIKRKSQEKGLAKKYGFTNETTIQIIYTIVDSFDTITSVDFHEHPEHDLSILKFKGFKKVTYSGHAEFPAHNNYVEQGEFLCRLGYPFPEFTNFEYDKISEKLKWNKSGNLNSPIFPIEGMVTRKLNDSKGVEFGIELSRPGLRGQSGGPLFNYDGLILGMQTSTHHLHLGFDIIDKEEYIKGKKKKISHYPYLNLGICINHVEIKKWLDSHKISYSIK
jgi:hypothetical protein